MNRSQHSPVITLDDVMLKFDDDDHLFRQTMTDEEVKSNFMQHLIIAEMLAEKENND